YVELGHLYALTLRNYDLVTATVNSGARLDAEVAHPTIFRLVLGHLQPAHHPAPVQLAVMKQILVHIVGLFVLEVPLNQQLTGEVVVPRERAGVAFEAATNGGFAFRFAHAHPCLSYLTL